MEDTDEANSESLKMMLALKSEEDRIMLIHRIESLIFFLSTAKNVLDESKNTDLEEAILWFEKNTTFRFFREVSVLESLISEYKIRLKL